MLRGGIMALKSFFNIKKDKTEFPSDYINYLNQGDKLLKNNKYESAIKLYDKAAQLNPYAPLIYLSKGKALYSLKTYKDALSCFEKVIKLKPDIFEAYYYMGILLINFKKYKEACDTFDIYLKLNNKNSEVYIYKAVALMENSLYDEAFNSLEEAKKLDPENKLIFIKEALILSQKGDYETALSYINTALLSNKNNDSLYLEKGICLYKTKKISEALECFYEAVKINSNCKNAYYYIGKIESREFYKYKKALISLDKYISLEPLDYKGYLEKINAQIELRNYSDALSLSDLAIKVNKNIPELYYEKGLIYLLLGKWNEALKDFDEALKLNNSFKEAIDKREYVLKMLSRIETHEEENRPCEEMPVKKENISKELNNDKEKDASPKEELPSEKTHEEVKVPDTISHKAPEPYRSLDEDLKLFKYILDKDYKEKDTINFKDFLDGQDIEYLIEDKDEKESSNDIKAYNPHGAEDANFENIEDLIISKSDILEGLSDNESEESPKAQTSTEENVVSETINMNLIHKDEKDRLLSFGFKENVCFTLEYSNEDLEKFDKLVDEIHFMPFNEGQKKLWDTVFKLNSFYNFSLKDNKPYCENINEKLWLLVFSDIAHAVKCIEDMDLNKEAISILSIEKENCDVVEALNSLGIYGLWFNKGPHCFFVTLEDFKKLIGEG